MSGLSVYRSLYAVFGCQMSMHSDICQHLTYLLNARQGSLVCLPDYGLPDLLSIFRRLPAGLYDFLNIMKQNIEKYEPRLKNVCVQVCEAVRLNEILQLHITADDIAHQALTFKAIVSQFDGVSVVYATPRLR